MNLEIQLEVASAGMMTFFPDENEKDWENQLEKITEKLAKGYRRLGDYSPEILASLRWYAIKRKVEAELLKRPKCVQ